MLKKSFNSFTTKRSALQPFLWAMLLVLGFHLTHISQFQVEKNEGTFYEISNTKVSSPCLNLQNLHHSDFATFETEEKEEKSETESNIGLGFGSINSFSAISFFLVSGASIKSLKIPSKEGKAPLYILFKNFRVHLA
ncbi:hypothetical protein [Aquiflexum gelatinilyticum]|uniref:Uncharacterized protein n=1 Tax=Aquiflexum gelatinilyticum TaxID=2961943 RepID=A0A9X2P2T2_9BACT|nr:hypothetical protein [Aquiflexum gelatinilyticum]MCR9013441.1 hypothetical protein [Aquiflexum gelatinilyticum]MCS4436482.1 hypothetical protein [Aquiflexum gelatinilyticum]